MPNALNDEREDCDGPDGPDGFDSDSRDGGVAAVLPGDGPPSDARVRPLLLDLFCGAGGATRGYQLAGFEVWGMDIKDQPNYCGDAFMQGDAIDYLEWIITGHKMRAVKAIHASPPCQDHSMSKNSAGLHGTGWLLQATLDLLEQIGLPYVVENVVGAVMPSAIELCGASFGLGVSGMDLPRHRRFQCSFPIMSPPCQHRKGKTLGVYGHGTNKWHREKLGRNILESEKREAMGIDWMSRSELAQAIPPAYTEFIGAQLLAVLGATDAPH